MCDVSLKSAWKSYIESKFTKDINQVLLCNLNSNDLPTISEKFYKDIFEMWADLHNIKPANGQQACSQMICENSYIRIDGTPIKKETWKYDKIKYIQDLINRNGEIDTRENIEIKYNVAINPMRYNSVIWAIPRDWKNLIKNDMNATNYHVFADYNVIIQEKEKKLIEITSKEAYWHLLNKIEHRATSEEKWENETCLKFDKDQWEETYMLPYKLTRNVKIISFQYKIVHRTLACKRNLKTWKIKTNNICDVCENEIDSLEHHLVSCPELLTFWDSFFHWWKAIAQMSFPVDTYNIIFGIPNPNNDLTILHLNYLILHAMYHIYVSKQKTKKPDLYEYIIEIKNSLDINQINMESKDQQKQFEKIWAPLQQLI
jgi:hypothetical protein